MRTLYLDCGMGAAGDMEFILRKKKRKNAVLQEHTVR